MLKTSRNKFKFGLIAIAALAFLIGAVVTWRTYETTSENSKQNLMHRAETVAAALDPVAIASIAAIPDAVSNSSYQHLKKLIIQVRDANPDVRFVYITEKFQKNVVFLLDSEYPSSADYSPPGQVYYEASPEFIATFENGKPLLEGPLSDRWGTWLTASAPIIDRETNNVVGVVGMDISSHNYYVELLTATALPTVLTLAFLILLLVVYFFERQQEKLLEMQYQFISIASHELRSPLNGISWASQSMLGDKKIPLTGGRREIMQNVVYTTSRLLETVNDILNLSALEKGRNKLSFTQVNLVGFCLEVIKDYTLPAKEHQVVIVMDKNWPVEVLVLIDQDKVRRAIGNIVSNAIKYSKPKTTITIGYVRSKDSSSITFFVKDEGIGIPKTALKDIFKGYYRADNAVHATTHGTGLGLYFARKTIEQHGGALWCESKEGSGSTFYIRLPKKAS